MRDLTGLEMTGARSPKGLSFDVPDLLLASGWAERHDYRMMVRLDHGTETEEYEEVIALYANRQPMCRFLMWRSADAVFLQPLPGRRRRFGSVTEALSTLRG